MHQINIIATAAEPMKKNHWFVGKLCNFLELLLKVTVPFLPLRNYYHIVIISYMIFPCLIFNFSSAQKIHAKMLLE